MQRPRTWRRLSARRVKRAAGEASGERQIRFRKGRPRGTPATLRTRAPIDETKVLETADRIMSFEREIKRAHLGMLVRLRNALTAAQLAKLDAIRKSK